MSSMVRSMVTKDVQVLISSIVPSNVLASHRKWNQVKQRKIQSAHPHFPEYQCYHWQTLAEGKGGEVLTTCEDWDMQILILYGNHIATLIMMFKVSLMTLLLRVNRTHGNFCFQPEIYYQEWKEEKFTTHIFKGWLEKNKSLHYD